MAGSLWVVDEEDGWGVVGGGKGDEDEGVNFNRCWRTAGRLHPRP